MSTGPIERQTVWDTAVRLISEKGGFAEFDRGISELVTELFGYDREEAPTLLEALRLRQQQQRQAVLPIDPTTGSPR